MCEAAMCAATPAPTPAPTWVSAEVTPEREEMMTTIIACGQFISETMGDAIAERIRSEHTDSVFIRRMGDCPPGGVDNVEVALVDVSDSALEFVYGVVVEARRRSEIGNSVRVV